MIERRKLFLLRHGIAAVKGAAYPDDRLRPLTRKGMREIERAAQGMKALGMKFDLILTSPYGRARQTAEIVARGLGLRKKIKLSSALRSEAKPGEILRELKTKYGKYKRLLLVGHEPFLSRLISILISGKDGCSLDFKKGSLCKLNANLPLRPQSATLKWLLTPKQLMSFR